MVSYVSSTWWSTHKHGTRIRLFQVGCDKLLAFLDVLWRQILHASGTEQQGVIAKPVLFKDAPKIGSAPSTVKQFRSEIRNKSGNTLETLSEQILNFQVSSGWRFPNPGK